MPVDISATKPASQPGNPSWATNGGTRVAPTLGQKQSGWTDGQRPPFNVMNWLQGFLSDWAKYLEDATDELDSGKLSRKGAGASTPQGMIGTLSSERSKTDDLGAVATPWATIWGVVLNLSDALAHITINGTAVLTDVLLTLAADTGTKNTARTRQLTARNIPKAWALLQPDGAGNVSILDGFNIATAVISGNNIIVTLASGFSSSNAACVLSSVAGREFFAAAVGGAGHDTITISAKSHTDGTTAVNLDNVLYPLAFVCFGVQ